MWDLTGDLTHLRRDKGLEGRIGNVDLKYLC